MEWKKILVSERRRDSVKKYKSEYDNRSEFEKDYHRIIGSASFRRLQDKTQVFPLDKSDFIRTRLTHSLEVSSIAKSLGQSVCHWLINNKEVTQMQAGEIQDILLCAGLLHDIGNPPFGHFGEIMIREWFQKNLSDIYYKDIPVKSYLSSQMLQDLYNFEGNAQSLRVVSKLHYLVDEKGMNLTKAVMNTIIKYPVSSLEIKKSSDIRYKKMGYFYADEDIFQSIVNSTGAGTRRYPLTYLLEAADDISYCTADLEDGFKKGLIDFPHLLFMMENNIYGDRREKEEYRYCEDAIQKLKDLYERAKNQGESNPELYAVQNWIIFIQGRLINAATYSFVHNYHKIMEGTMEHELLKGSYGEYLADTLKKIEYKLIFQSKDIIKSEIAASTILEFLLDNFVRAAIYDGEECNLGTKYVKLMELISDNYKRIYQMSSKGKEEGEKLYLRMLLATDYISGMTDHYAKMLYQEFNGIS
ncbi:MAG: deoxyguanosinetriphosphate triphosphohydrolase [Lachnospiraceae bacterium]|jgi:dGTPase|nr:deoxyguanosinetriphosphate triphosphohydrolase [Lachnospiraceae bacterium]